MGAGTFDVVLLLDQGDGNFKTVAVGGDEFLGSANIEECFVKYLKEEMLKIDHFNEESFEHQITDIKAKMKNLKENLSAVEDVSETIYGVTSEPYRFIIDEPKKEEILTAYYKKAEKVILDAFKRAAELSSGKYTSENIMNSVDIVCLVGGGMIDPFFSKKMLPVLFKTANIVGGETISQVEVVARGNVFWAAARNKTPTLNGLPPEPVNINVLSKALGIQSITGYKTNDVKFWFSKIIPSNKVLPCLVSRGGFTTVEDNQERVIVEVYQGEGDFTTDEDVASLGSFEVPLKLPNLMSEMPQIEVEMEVKLYFKSHVDFINLKYF